MTTATHSPSKPNVLKPWICAISDDVRCSGHVRHHIPPRLAMAPLLAQESATSLSIRPSLQQKLACMLASKMFEVREFRESLPPSSLRSARLPFKLHRRQTFVRTRRKELAGSNTRPWRTNRIVPIGRRRKRSRILEDRIQRLLRSMHQEDCRSRRRALTMYATLYILYKNFI